jgi:hypothetical protein
MNGKNVGGCRRPPEFEGQSQCKAAQSKVDYPLVDVLRSVASQSLLTAGYSSLRSRISR